jgi:2-polyprenyl-3-methyl-5-hydroxy-6-metoxy-1,4-benzoquinol methylase
MPQPSGDLLHYYTQQNRRAWNEIARVRSMGFPPAEFFANGQSTLAPRVIQVARDAFGDLAGLRVIHLQCSTGEDTLSWSVNGAVAVGVDIAEQQIDIARQKAAQAGVSAEFTAADVYDLPAGLPVGLRHLYDLVFTGGGALVWLPDLTHWAEIVAGLLSPGGHLLLVDEHPVSACLWVENNQLQIESDYFARSIPEKVHGWSHFKGGEDAHETKYEFSWPLADIVTSLAQAGLIIERMEEFPGGPEWRYGELQEASNRLPGEFLILAKKG